MAVTCARGSTGGFYARFGCTERRRTQGYPHGHDDIHLMKQLD
jgi:hypothetical protein